MASMPEVEGVWLCWSPIFHCEMESGVSVICLDAQSEEARGEREDGD